MQASWNLNSLAGYMDTWSASKLYYKEKGERPTSVITKDLLAAWADPKMKINFEWKLGLKVGRFV